MNTCSLLTCSVCQINKAEAIITSSLISASYATCKTCYNNMAEPRWIFNYLLEHEDNIKHDYITMFYTYHEGKYIDWKTYKKEKSNSSNSKE